MLALAAWVFPVPCAVADTATASSANGTEAVYPLAGRVVRVSDGDTFQLLVKGRQLKVRMASIDAPELGKDAKRPGQPQARASKNALAALIAGKTLTLACYEADHYGRHICDVPLSGSLSANQHQVASGMAFVNRERRGEFMRDAALPALEDQARRERLGVWRDGDAVPPWVWRYRCWQRRQC
jgi:endonuclease YncB( thermonuclease family)